MQAQLDTTIKRDEYKYKLYSTSGRCIGSISIIFVDQVFTSTEYEDAVPTGQKYARSPKEKAERDSEAQIDEWYGRSQVYGLIMKHVNLYKKISQSPEEVFNKEFRRAQSEAVHEGQIELEDEEHGTFTVELDDDI